MQVQVQVHKAYMQGLYPDLILTLALLMLAFEHLRNQNITQGRIFKHFFKLLIPIVSSGGIEGRGGSKYL